MSESGIKVFNADSGNLEYEFAPVGRGPAEYLAFSIQRGPGEATLEISDTANRRNDLLDLECLKRKPPQNLLFQCIIESKKNYASRQALIIEDELLFNHGSEPDGVVFLSNETGIISFLVTTPVEINNKYERTIHQAMSQTGSIAANTERSHFAYFADSYDKAVFFKYENKMMITIKALQPTFFPEFDIIQLGDGTIMQEAKEYQAAFTFSTASDDHFYALYSGKKYTISQESTFNRTPFTKRIKQFKLNGDFVRDIYLDKEVFTLDVDKANSTIYAIAVDSKDNY
jgi:hypothetical protein